MELVAIARRLVRHPWLVAVGVALSIFAGLSVVYHVSYSPPGLASKQTSGEIKAGRLLIDAPNDPAIDLESTIVDTLGIRAVLLAEMLSSTSSRSEIAQAVGLGDDELLIAGPTAGAPSLPLTLAVRASQASIDAPAAYKVIIDASERTGIIRLTVGGADPAKSAAIVRAASHTLEDIIATRTPRGPQLSVEQLGPILTTRVTAGPGPAVGILVGILVLVTWCGAIVVLAGLRRRYRQGRARARARRLPDAVVALRR